MYDAITRIDIPGRTALNFSFTHFTKVIKYECNYCSKSFNYKTNLQIHLKIIHRIHLKGNTKHKVDHI